MSAAEALEAAESAADRDPLLALLPIVNAAVECVAQGLASPREVDGLFEISAAPSLGPLSLADRIGLDRCVEALDALHRSTGRSEHRPSPLLRQMVRSGLLGCRTGAGFFDYPRQGARPGPRAAGGLR